MTLVSIERFDNVAPRFGVSLLGRSLTVRAGRRGWFVSVPWAYRPAPMIDDKEKRRMERNAELFKPGTTVCLKSGGPLMTVCQYQPYKAGSRYGWIAEELEGVWATWFDDQNRLQRSLFDISCVKLV